MPYKDPYSERAIRSKKECQKRYREKHKEKDQQRHKKYREENKDKIRARQKEYEKTSPIYYKKYIICGWKQKGIIDDDYDLLFEVYKKETHCWLCGKEYVKRNDKHLDHDHGTGEPRYICCRSCNTKLGYWEN